MTDVHTCRLCVQIIHSHFGTLTAAVASTLVTRGRLSLGQLIRFSSLKPSTVRASVLVLVQHNLLWHTQTEDGAVVELIVEECLLRLRFGRFVWLTDQLFGKAATEIVQVILDNGKLRPPDIMTLLAFQDPKNMAVYHQALYKLVSGAYLKPTTITSHVSPRDKQIKYEADEKAKISGLPTAKALRDAKEVAKARLKREDEESEKIGLKRKAKDQLSNRSSKKKSTGGRG